MFHRLACSLFFILAVSACSSRSDIVTPEISVVGMSLQNASLLESKALFEVRVQNENEFPIEVEKAIHLFEVNGVRLGKALDDKGFTVPAFGSTKIPVELNVSSITVLSRFGELTKNRLFNYRIASTLFPKGKEGKIKVSQQGRFRP